MSCRFTNTQPKITGGLTVTTMIRWCLVLIQYVALCGAFTTQNPAWNSGGIDPFFGASWWNQPNSGSIFQTATQMPQLDVVAAPVNVPANEPLVPAETPAPKPPTYDTATPVKVTKPVVKSVPTETSISLTDLLRLAVGGITGQAKGANDVLSEMFSVRTDSTEPKPKPNAPDTAPSGSVARTQKFVTTAPPATTQGAQKEVVPTKKSSTTTASTTTTTTTTTPKPITTTTTTPKPTSTTTQAPAILKTEKPLSQMTLGEILRLQSKMYPETKQPTEKKTGRPRGCYFKGQFYKPLSEIEKGQTGNWCYGSYCNHEGTVVHWDDHKCTTTPSTPAPTQPTVPTTPVTQPPITNPAQTGGMLNFMNMARIASMPGTGNTAGMSDMARMAAMMSGAAGTSSVSGNDGSGIGTNNSGMGCFHNGQWYAPGADIENLRDYGRCYGSYCNYNSEIVRWNDRCTATVPPPTTVGMGSQFSYMDQMGMASQGGMGAGMSQLAMGGEGLGIGGGGMGMGGEGMGMSQMALGGEGLGIGGGGLGMSQMAMGGEGFGMTGEGGMGMAGQGGMGARTQGGLSMRQLQQLDLI